MALKKWVAEHPHLAELACLHEQLEHALATVVDGQGQIPPPTMANEELPLLLHYCFDQDFLNRAGAALCQLLEALPVEGLPAQFSEQCRQLRERLRQSPDEAVQMIDDECIGGSRIAHAMAADSDSSLPHFLIWKLLAKLVRPLQEPLKGCLDELGWQEAHCPLCGAGPAMAQITRSKKGSIRLLICGCCETRWPYKRIGCPFCGMTEAAQLSILELEDVPLRIDTCQHCQGFLKTYTGSGEEAVMLADWTTLHLDALAMQRGWQRRADSLYRL